MACGTGVVCACCLPLQPTATHSVHLRLHHHSSWSLLGSSGITSNVVVVTLSSADQERSIAASRECFAIRASPCVTKFLSALPNWPVANQLKTSQRQGAATGFPFQPLVPCSNCTPSFVLQQVHIAVCSICYKAGPMETAKSNSNKTDSSEKN